MHSNYPTVSIESFMRGASHEELTIVDPPTNIKIEKNQSLRLATDEVSTSI